MYGIEEHRHRFAVWAAARATQRGFTTVDKLRKALENCEVREFLKTRDFESVDEAEFKKLHRSWCLAIMSSLTSSGVKEVTFGRAAKLIAIYLKSMVVLGGKPESVFSKVAHPPIDGILLSNVAKSPNVESSNKSAWVRLRWTKLDEEAYYRLIPQLRAILGPNEPFWALEEHWTVTDKQTLA